MDRLNPWTVGTALAITVALAYAVCAILVAMFPEATVALLNSLFHGLDFRKLQAPGIGFSMAGFGMVVIVLAISGFSVGSLYAFVRNLLGR